MAARGAPEKTVHKANSTEWMNRKERFIKAKRKT